MGSLFLQVLLGFFMPTLSFSPRAELTLRGQRGYVLVAAVVDLVPVRVHGQHQHHDAAHDASSHGAHRGTLDHVQGDHFIS